MQSLIGVGTSPLMLMRAAQLAEGGNRVVLLDRSMRLGGGWAVDDVLGFSNVELGVHLLENRPELYSALARAIGVELATDACAIQLVGRLLPMHVGRMAFHAGVGLRSLGRFAPDRARRSFTSAWRATRNLGVDFRYPVGGASCILEALAARLAHAGGEIRLGQDVLSASLDHDGVRCETSGGAYAADGLLVSSRACPRLRILGTDQAPKSEASSVYTTVLRFLAPRGMKCSYVEILGDRALKRVRDLTPLVRPSPHGEERVWCVQCRAQGHADARSNGEEILRHLIRLGLVGEPAVVIAAFKTGVQLVTVTDRALLSMANASRGRLEVLRTTDLADGFVTQNAMVAWRSGGVSRA